MSWTILKIPESQRPQRTHLREPPGELMNRRISLVWSWASSSNNWLMMVSATKSSMLFPKKTILSLRSRPMASASPPRAAAGGAFGEARRRRRDSKEGGGWERECKFRVRVWRGEGGGEEEEETAEMWWPPRRKEREGTAERGGGTREWKGSVVEESGDPMAENSFISQVGERGRVTRGNATQWYIFSCSFAWTNYILPRFKNL